MNWFESWGMLSEALAEKTFLPEAKLTASIRITESATRSAQRSMAAPDKGNASRTLESQALIQSLPTVPLEVPTLDPDVVAYDPRFFDLNGCADCDSQEQRWCLAAKPGSRYNTACLQNCPAKRMPQ